MDDRIEILATLEEAENRVAELKKFILKQPLPVPGGPGDNQQAKGSKGAPSLSTKYMTLSTVKLFETRGVEVFRIPASVGLYHINPNSPVRTAARSAILRLVRIAEEYQDGFHPPAFIQVGEWAYPLMSGSMAYRSEQKYYLFPDLSSSTPGASVGVVLPHSSTDQERQEFERLLLGFCGMEEFPDHPPVNFGKSTDLILSARTSVQLIQTKSGVYSQRTSHFYKQHQNPGASGPSGVNDSAGDSYGRRIGRGIKAGVELVSRGVELGAIGTSNAMHMGTSCLKKVLPQEVNDREIPGPVVDGVKYAKEMTGRVVDISAAIMDKLVEMTSNFAALTACYVRAAAAPLVDKIVEVSGIDPDTVDMVSTEVRDLGEEIVEGGVKAYEGLRNAAALLAWTLNDNTTEVLEHCYGPAAARVLQNAGEVVGNLAISSLNARQAMDPDKVIRNTVRAAGVAVFTEGCREN